MTNRRIKLGIDWVLKMGENDADMSERIVYHYFMLIMWKKMEFMVPWNLNGMKP